MRTALPRAVKNVTDLLKALKLFGSDIWDPELAQEKGGQFFVLFHLKFNILV